MNDETLLIRVPAKMKAELQKLADADRRKLSEYLRLHLEDFLKTQKGKK